MKNIKNILDTKKFYGFSTTNPSSILVQNPHTVKYVRRYVESEHARSNVIDSLCMLMWEGTLFPGMYLLTYTVDFWANYPYK